MRARALLVTVVVSLAVAAFAQEKPSEPPPPNPLFQLQRLMGQYQCTGTAFAFGGQPEHKVTSTLTGKLIYDDHWLELTRVENKTAENPHPIDSRGFFAWDAMRKTFVFNGIISVGGYWMETGSAYTFEGPNHIPGMAPLKGRDTWKPGSIFVIGYQFEVEEGGTWKKVIEENCTRQ